MFRPIASGGGGGGYKEYTGQMTLASETSSFTMANPFGSAEKVKYVNIDLTYVYSGNIKFIRYTKSTNITHYANDYGNYYSNVGRVTISDTEITVNLTLKPVTVEPCFLIWEVIGIE